MQNVNLSVLFLSATTAWLVPVIVAVVALALGVVGGLVFYKSTTEKKVGSADERVRKIVADAETEAERIKAQGKEESKRAKDREENSLYI